MKRLLSDPNQSESIVEMGIHAGFNSKTSMNRTFRKFTRISTQGIPGTDAGRGFSRYEGLLRHETEIDGNKIGFSLFHGTFIKDMLGE